MELTGSTGHSVSVVLHRDNLWLVFWSWLCDPYVFQYDLCMGCHISSQSVLLKLVTRTMSDGSINVWYGMVRKTTKNTFLDFATRA